jgi:CRP-like cAMP-binding protein
MTMLPFKAGDYVFHEGDIGRDLLVISDGYLDVYNRAKGPDQPIATLGPNSLIGELAFLDAGPRTFSIRAITDGVAYALTTEAFENLAKKKPDLAMRLLRDISEILANRFRGLFAESAKSKPTQPAKQLRPDIQPPISSQ